MNETHVSPISRSVALTRANFEYDSRTWEVLNVDSKSLTAKTADDKKTGKGRRMSYFNFTEEQLVPIK